MTPLIYRSLAFGFWSLFAFLCFVLWPDLVGLGYAIEPMEPVDMAILLILGAALFTTVLQAIIGEKFVLAAPVPKRSLTKVPSTSAKVGAGDRRPADRSSRSSQRLAAVQAKFDTPLPPDVADDLRDIHDDMVTVRQLEKAGKLTQALALAERKADKPAMARLHMKLGQYLHALDDYVDLEDFEGAAMAATLKGDSTMARAFWRQAALNLQNAGAANPNTLGGLWDRAGNPAAAAASYEAGGMVNKARECFEVSGDAKSAERCRQKMALQTATDAPMVINQDEAKASAKYLAEKGDLFGAAEALLEAKLYRECASYYELCGDLTRAAKYYDLGGDTDSAASLLAKVERQGEVDAATGVHGMAASGDVPTLSPQDPDFHQALEGFDTETRAGRRMPTPLQDSAMPSGDPSQTVQRKRAGVIAMEAAGIEVPSEVAQGAPSGGRNDTPPSDPGADTATRMNAKRIPSEADNAATTVRKGPRPAGTVRNLAMSTVDLKGSGAGSLRGSSVVEFTETERAPFVPFPGELPTPNEVFSAPPPLPWKSGWPLVAPQPRSIGVPLFASVSPGEALLVHPPAFSLGRSADGEGDSRAPSSQDTTEAMMRVQSLAGQGKFREAAEVAATIEAWAAAATLLDNGRFWSEAADLWRRLGQWSNAVDALQEQGRYQDGALLYLAAGRVGRAVAVLRRGIRNQSEKRGTLAALAGRILVLAGRVDLAVRLLRLVVAPEGPGAGSAVAVYRLARILEDNGAVVEAHSMYVALMEAGARNEDLRQREQNLARLLGTSRYQPSDSEVLVGDADMTAFDAMVTRVDSPTDFPTLIDGRPVTLEDLNADQAIEWVMRSQPSIRSRGIVRPRMLAKPFPMTLPEDLAERNQPAKADTAARVASSPLSVSLFGAPLAPPEPWSQEWRFTVKETRSTLGPESLFLADDKMLQQVVSLRVFGRGLVRARGLAWVADRIRSLAALGHPNLVPVLDMGVADLQPYLVERFYPTGSLADRLKIGGALPFAAALRIFVQIGRGLEAAGRMGLVHGHIHPGQVLFGPSGEALLSSWGVEVIRKGPDILESFPKGAASARPDIRALGLLAYVAISGQPPADRNPLPLHGVRPDVPEAFGQIVEWCIGLDPKRRYHAVGEFMPAVEQLVTAM